MNIHLKSAVLSAAMMLAAPVAQAEIKVGVLVSMTGPGSTMGEPYSRAYQIASSEIGGEKVTYIAMDDGSDPSRGVQNARKLIQEDKVDALIGFNGVQIPRAVLPLLAEFKVPAISGAPLTLTGTDADWFLTVVQPVETWMVPIVEHMAANGIKTVGFIGYADTWGDDALRLLTQLGADKGITVIAEERFARGDTSTTPQVLKLVAAAPDAVYIGAGNTGSALPMLDLAQIGYDGPTYHTNAVVIQQFVDVAGDAAEGTYAVTGAISVVDALPDDNPNKIAAEAFIEKFNATYGANTVNSMAGYAWDTSLVFEAAAAEALKTAKPGTEEFRSALRTAMHAVNGVVGVHATFSFSEGSSNGVGPESAILVQLVDRKWRVVE